MGGSRFGMPRISRWISCIVLGLFLFGLLSLSSPVQAAGLGITAIHPLVYPDGVLYAFNLGDAPADISYAFYADGTKVRELNTYDLDIRGTDRIELSKVPGLVSGTPYSLIIISDMPVESAVYVNRPSQSGDGLGAYRDVSPYSEAVFGPFFHDPANGIESTVTLFNPSSTEIDVDVTFTAADGIVVGGVPVTIKISGMDFYNIAASNVVLLDSGFTGSVRAVSKGDGQFAGILQYSSANQFSISSAIYDSNFTVPSGPTYVTHFPRLLRSVTDGYVTRSSQLVLFNPEAGVDAQVDFQDSEGGVIPVTPTMAGKNLAFINLKTTPGLVNTATYSAVVTSDKPVYLAEQTLLDASPYLPSAGYGGSSQDQLFLTGLRRETGLATMLSVQNTFSDEQVIRVEFFDLSGLSRYQYTASILAGDAVRLDLEHLPGLGGAFDGSAVIYGDLGSVAAWVDRVPVPTALFLPLVDNNTCVSGLISPHAITDYYFGLQDNMAQIHADDAWKQCNMGSSDVVVAVVDTGVDLNHPDFSTRLLSGYDFVYGDSTPQDYHGHGTHVAGIIAAGMNGEGVVGVAPNIKILPVQVLDASGSGYTSWIANGIIWAADRAQVINISLGGPVDGDGMMQNAINYTQAKGRLVVAAAGNCGNNSNPPCKSINQPLYPAAFPNPNVIAVAALYGDLRAPFSNYGNYVDVAAPGWDIFSTYLHTFWNPYIGDYGYQWLSGTSQATPHVAGLAALIWSRYPSYMAEQVRSVILNTAQDLGTDHWDPYFGWGRIDVAAALGLSGSLSVSDVPMEDQNVEPAPQEDRSAEILEGFVLVKFKPEVNDAGLQKAMSAFPQMRLESALPALGVQRFQVPAGEEWKLIDLLRARPDVEYAGPEYIYYSQ